MDSHMTETAHTPPLTGFSVSESPLCRHCGHVRGLHGRDHGCISAFADGEAGKSCGCPGFVRTPPEKTG